ncbi:hypothetical protein V9T40_001916 [Parthenolecanium corni]|uniref:Uncharacterized protein n=1 Tax=Parthenolecanium corni TaxID=536013 RepID=A0AAN9TJV8_9HEMI
MYMYYDTYATTNHDDRSSSHSLKRYACMLKMKKIKIGKPLLTSAKHYGHQQEDENGGQHGDIGSAMDLMTHQTAHHFSPPLPDREGQDVVSRYDDVTICGSYVLSGYNDVIICVYYVIIGYDDVIKRGESKRRCVGELKSDSSSNSGGSNINLKRTRKEERMRIALWVNDARQRYKKAGESCTASRKRIQMSKSTKRGENTDRVKQENEEVVLGRSFRHNRYTYNRLNNGDGAPFHFAELYAAGARRGEGIRWPTRGAKIFWHPAEEGSTLFLALPQPGRGGSADGEVPLKGFRVRERIG